MPFVIIADSVGGIISRHVGYKLGDEKELEKEILHLLTGQQPLTDSLQVKPETSVPEIPFEQPADEIVE